MENMEALKEEALTTITYAIQALARRDYHWLEMNLAIASEKAAKLRAMDEGVEGLVSIR